MPMI